MNKIVGLDLGTNSIGWGIRDINLDENQFIDFDENGKEILNSGVVVFRKGVGDGKSGEFSLAAERRSHRSKRRLYNAKRYRKWATLKVLSKNNMCPISVEELHLWSAGNWQQIDGKMKNRGRVYPSSPDFLAWLAMDFDKIGKDWEGEKLNPEYRNIYALRVDLLEKYSEDDVNRLYKIGRAFYHLCQLRGFKSSRKNGKSTYGKNEYLESEIEKNPDWKVAQVLLKGLENDSRRIRNSGVIQRQYFEDEFWTICKKQNLNTKLSKLINVAIYDNRDNRSQKGLVGKCTLEKGKSRIPISHPLFEEFRALQFINNIKWRETGSKKRFEEIPIELKKRILEEIFFKKITRGDRKRMVNDRVSFDFLEIVDAFSENHKYEFNYAQYKNKKFELKRNPSVAACPVIAGLMNAFDGQWVDVFVIDTKTFGVNWNDLKLNYTPVYEGEVQTYKKRNYSYKDIWHLLFDFLQTKDDEDGLREFCLKALKWSEDRTDIFCDISISQGYGSLSYSAINKITPFLREGYIYSEAVSFANLKSVLGKKHETNRQEAEKLIARTIKEVSKQKELLNITNGLIQNHFKDNPSNRAKGLDGTVEQISTLENDVKEKLSSYFGTSVWTSKSETEQKLYFESVCELYFKFIDGKQLPKEKAASRHEKNPKIDYYKLPRLDEAIKHTLKKNFRVTDKDLKKLFHPSDINIYPKSKTGRLEDPNPPSKGWKNPMAMRTMYELRKLINYLLDEGRIDENTKVVVEMARELNTSNYRKAYTIWVQDKEKENQEYAKAIAELINDNANLGDRDKKKFQSAIEQVSSYHFSQNKSDVFYKKYNEFVDTYLKKDEDKIDDYDYLMYLILRRDEFHQLLNAKIPNSNKFINQIIRTTIGFTNKKKELQKLIDKYLLWKEQQFQCLYTGDVISFSELFSGNYEIEHTIPAVISSDNSLSNWSICDKKYNGFKSNRFPTECPNYYHVARVQTNSGLRECSPIKNRVDRFIEPKVEGLKARIENLKRIGKKIPDWEKDKKNANIRLRHYLSFELDYWEKKHRNFTVKKENWIDGWKNSQLVDTQIISKYARAYLKTVFNRVDVQKGSVTNTFKKIYGIKGDGQKDRSKHTHHAIDAMTLTLIPGSSKREAILDEYHKNEDKKIKGLTTETYHITPHNYDNFNYSHIESITNKIAINHITKDQTLVEAKKRLRKRGKVQKTIDGKIIWQQGDGIRGQLHKESYFGAIKVNKRNEQGYAIKENNRYILSKDGDKDEIWIVMRKPIEKVDFEKDEIIDKVLEKHLIQQLDNGVPQIELKDFNKKPIRRIRCRVKAGRGYLSAQKAIPIKEHAVPFVSKHEHKRYVLAQNDENYLYLFYEGSNAKGKVVRGYRILNLLDVVHLEIDDINEIKQISEFQTLTKGKNTLSLQAILRVGDRVIPYVEHRDELENKILMDRLFIIVKFNEPAPSTAYIYIQNHLEARQDSEVKKDEEKDFDPSKYQPRLYLSSAKFNCLIEHLDFVVKPDGKILLL